MELLPGTMLGNYRVDDSGGLIGGPAPRMARKPVRRPEVWRALMQPFDIPASDPAAILWAGRMPDGLVPHGRLNWRRSSRSRKCYSGRYAYIGDRTEYLLDHAALLGTLKRDRSLRATRRKVLGGKVRAVKAWPERKPKPEHVYGPVREPDVVRFAGTVGRMDWLANDS